MLENLCPSQGSAKIHWARAVQNHQPVFRLHMKPMAYGISFPGQTWGDFDTGPGQKTSTTSPGSVVLRADLEWLGDLKKVKQLRRFSQFTYLSCFCWFLTLQGISWFLGKSRGNYGQSECQDQDISTGEWEHVWGRRLITIQRLGKIMEHWLC